MNYLGKILPACASFARELFLSTSDLAIMRASSGRAGVMQESRKIIHIDMDAFFASVEQRDNPTLVGKPVIVGGRPGGRGVVAAASYEARAYGVRSAMASSRAYSLCPHAIFLKPRFSVYKHVSRTIMGILREYSPLVEPLSVDEAFLDVTNYIGKYRYASRIAKHIKATIKKHTGLNSSAGVAPNKFLAKIASDMNKPNGLCVITPEQVDDFLLPLEVRRIPGIGSVTEAKLLRKGITKVSHLRAKELSELEQLFGSRALWFYNICRGIDEREIKLSRIAKSVSVERTFPEDITDRAVIDQKLTDLSEELVERLSKKSEVARTLTLKVTYSDFQKITRSKTFQGSFQDSEHVYQLSQELLFDTEAGSRPIRLLGLGFSGLENNEQIQTTSQLPLFF
ncbi:MAG: DNA polymerase IV [Bdellovibrionales bacterium]|nr:DNA polymerase IV [Bdellovibrionales bacterium]